MSVIRETLDRYPSMARGGWCYAGNTSITGYNPLDLTDKFAVEERMQTHINGMQHMKADACLIGFGSYEAYDNEDRYLSHSLPVFIRVNDKKFLGDLHYEGRNEEIEKAAEAVEFEITRFDLMDPVEEGEEL